jgi:cytochrome b
MFMTMDRPSSRVRVWDLPTRLFHVFLIVCVLGLIVTGELAGEAMVLHFWFGYGVLTLVLFRLVWGLFGGHWSRFVNFVPTLTSLRRYIAGRADPLHPRSVGHNPLGALSVLAMLSVLLLQVLSGFMSDDEVSVSGPWTALVPNAWVELATEYHTEIGKVLLIALVVLHVGSVLYYKYFQHDDLITPMISGDKELAPNTQDSRDSLTSRAFALSILIGCAYLVYRLVQIGT